MNREIIRKACLSVGFEEPISIEPDGTVWLGLDDNRTYPDMAPIWVEYEKLVQQESVAKQELLDRLGITAEEARLLLS